MMGRVQLFTVLLLVLCQFWHVVSSAGCSGLRRVILDSLEGIVTDGEGFYEENVHCEWLIRAPDPNMTITLTFSEFETECTYDFLTIYDGDSFPSTVLATFSGNLLPAPVQAKSGSMLIHLYSDTNYPLNGTTATYKIQNCSNDCSGHGTCENYRCLCDNGYVGESCEWQSCPLECGYSQGRGDCDFMAMVQKCSCRNGFVGEGCSLSTTNNTNWGDTLLVSSGIDTIFEARTGHTAEYHDTTNSLWVFGGKKTAGRRNFQTSSEPWILCVCFARKADMYATISYHCVCMYSSVINQCHIAEMDHGWEPFLFQSWPKFYCSQAQLVASLVYLSHWSTLD